MALLKSVWSSVDLQSESTRKNCNSYDHVDQMNNGDNFNIESTSKRTQQLQTLDLKYDLNGAEAMIYLFTSVPK